MNDASASWSSKGLCALMLNCFGTNDPLARRFRPLGSRDIFIHSGGVLRRVRVSGPVQFGLAMLTVVLVAWSLFAAATLLGVGYAADRDGDTRADAVQAQISAVRAETQARAERIEQRQDLLATMIAGGEGARVLDAHSPELDRSNANGLAAPLIAAEARQLAFFQAARVYIEDRYDDTVAAVRALGLSPRRVERLGAAMGGPYEALPASDEAGDPQFRALFETWSRLDQLERGVMSVPSQKPVDNLVFTSLYGVRSDPFRGSRAMHAGVDIPGPVGTPIYATADGIVGRAQYVGAYGNLVEVRHGRGIETRYAHLSRILVKPNSRVTRGQLIGHMGSTGRSTGSHLHYEVRIDGHAVDPTPFLKASDFVLAVQDRMAVETAQGGPDDESADD